MGKRFLNFTWNILAFLTLASIAGVVVLVAQIFHDPASFLNPYPPPTIPAQIILPSPTITNTLTLSSTPPLTLEPSLIPTDSPLASLTPSPTDTDTPTPTITQTPTITPTPTGHLTLTAMADMSMFDIRTAQAATSTVQAIQQVQTYAVESRFGPNPAFAIANNGALSDQWSTSIPDEFTWVKPREDMIGYYYYWGPYSLGINKKPVYDNRLVMSFDTQGKGPGDGGIYFFRLRAIYANGVENPDWSTVFVFKLDVSAPRVPQLIDADRAVNDVWRKYSYTPVFIWSNATDNASGLSYYDLYWGNDPDSITPTYTQIETIFTPKLESGIFYLKIRTVDIAGNTSAWRRLFTLRVDNSPPEIPDINTLSLYPPYPPNAYTQDAITINWQAVQDAESGVSYYDIYWGNDPKGATPGFTIVASSFIPPPMITPPGTSKTYFLRIRAVDFLGNASEWSAPFSIVYDPD